MMRSMMPAMYLDAAPARTMCNSMPSGALIVMRSSSSTG